MSKIIASTLHALRKFNSLKNTKNISTTKLIMGEQHKTNEDKLINTSDSWFNRYQEVKVNTDGIFEGVIDRFNGITIDSKEENCDNIDNFKETLDKSLNYWTENKKRGIWFKVRHKDAEWVPILAKNNFYFHHARDDFVMMYKWLPKNESGIIPPYSHTMVGVGALVVSDDDEVLVVSERNALIPNSWKLPGGYLERNENLVDAAVREVLEETNIETKFESLVSVRHAHGAAFGCSDLYVVFALKPLTKEIKKCEREIAECKWMKIEEYLQNTKQIHQTNRSFMEAYLYNKKHGITINMEEAEHQILKKKYNLYFVKKE